MDPGLLPALRCAATARAISIVSDRSVVGCAASAEPTLRRRAQQQHGHNARGYRAACADEDDKPISARVACTAAHAQAPTPSVCPFDSELVVLRGRISHGGMALHALLFFFFPMQRRRGRAVGVAAPVAS